MRPARARRFFSTIAVSPETARATGAVAYGVALGFQLYYVKALIERPERARLSAMRRAGRVTAAVEGGLYDAAFARLGDDFLAAQESHRGKRLVLNELLEASSGFKRGRARPGIGRPGIGAVLRSGPGRLVGRRGRARAVTASSVRALRSSVLGPEPMMASAYEGPHDYRALWTPQDRRVEHQLLIALEELLHGPLPARTEANLRPFADAETGLLLPWDEAAGAEGEEAVDRAVLEYLMDSRYGDGVLAGAKEFNAARAKEA